MSSSGFNFNARRFGSMPQQDSGSPRLNGRANGIAPARTDAPPTGNDAGGTAFLLGSFENLSGDTGGQSDLGFGQGLFPGQSARPGLGLPADMPGTLPSRGQSPVNISLVEIGAYTNGNADEHARQVRDVFRQNGRDLQGRLRFEGIGKQQPASADEEDKPPTLANADELGEFVDKLSTDALNLLSEKIQGNLQEGKCRVINGSLGFSRVQIYIEAFRALVANPELAKDLGLSADDVKSIKVLPDGRFDKASVNDNVQNAVSRFVDQRMDSPDSAFQCSLAHYQDLTGLAADNGMVVVLAVGNEGKLRNVFPESGLGVDTNFLAMSDNVITVAASDDHDTPEDTSDDTIADFSSRGNGRFKPTIATTGVQVDTNVPCEGLDGELEYKVDGTSFAAPKVAATVAYMLEANPHLTFEQVKCILQGTATDTAATPNEEGAGMLNAEDAIAVARQI